MINIEDHYGLVGWVIDRYFSDFLNRYPTLEYDDMFQEGVIALIEAAKKYDPNCNTAFSTYAVYGIQNRIEHFVTDNIRPINYSKATAERDRAVKHITDPEKIKEYLDLNDRQLLELIEYRTNSYSAELDPTRVHSGNDPSDQVALMDLLETFRGLDEENKQILILRAEGKTLRDIGDIVGYSHTTIANRLRKIKEEWLG